MTVSATHVHHEAVYPVRVHVEPALEARNRVTTAFRFILAVPHLILVGGPIAATLSWKSGASGHDRFEWGGGGVFGLAIGVVTLIAWFSILFTGKYPDGLRNIAVAYLRWRVRAVTYIALLRDEYPPFGEGDYPAQVDIGASDGVRDRLSVAFRIILLIPQLLSVWVLGIAWALTTIVAWFSIVFTGRYPAPLYEFAVGVLRWNTRVEAYALLLDDEYPPFSFH
jgi:hypothetical protein